MLRSQNFLKDVGRLVAATRHERYSQSEAGKRAGVSRSTISKIENGESVPTIMLAQVLESLDLLPDFQREIERQLSIVDSGTKRMLRTTTGKLDNDF